MDIYVTTTDSILCEQLHKSSPFNSTHYAKLYPQNDDRIVTIDSVTSLHPMYTQGDSEVISFDIDANLWVKLLEMFLTLLSLKYALSVV